MLFRQTFLDGVAAGRATLRTPARRLAMEKGDALEEPPRGRVMLERAG